MSCELFSCLKMMNFSDVPSCIYESGCSFSESRSINIIEASESCKAIKDVKEDDINTVEDILQDIKLRELIASRRVN